MRSLKIALKEIDALAIDPSIKAELKEKAIAAAVHSGLITLDQAKGLK